MTTVHYQLAKGRMNVDLDTGIVEGRLTSGQEEEVDALVRRTLKALERIVRSGTPTKTKS